MKYLDKINPFMNLQAIRNFSLANNNLANKLNNVIHVAGTNGKGSTVAFLRSILEANNYSVNVFTSPHLVKENERIRIKGKLISNKYNNYLNELIIRDSLGKKLSIFEKFVAKALIAFNQYPADFTILEVGLGGRLDATNIVNNPLISIITPIDLDHEHILGTTKSQIALEKAAIIKKHGLIVSAYQSIDVLDVLEKEATFKKAKLICGGINWHVRDIKLNSCYLYFNNFNIQLKNLSLLGKHQLYNASLAIVALKVILENKLTKKVINSGLKNTSWPGRLQKIDKNCLYGQVFDKQDIILLDGAHNEHGGKALVEYIKEKLQNRKIFIIMAMLKTKQLNSYLKLFTQFEGLELYGVNLNKEYNAYSSNEIVQSATNLKINSKVKSSIKKALKDIKTFKGKKLIIICGSLYLIGKVLEDNKLNPK